MKTKNIFLVSLFLLCNLSMSLAAFNSKAYLEGIKKYYSDYDKKTSNMYMKGKISIKNTKQAVPEQSFEFYKKADKFRMDVNVKMDKYNNVDMPKSLQNTTTNMIYDGKDYWVIAPVVGKRKVSKKDIGVDEMGVNAFDTFKDFNVDEWKYMGDENIQTYKCAIYQRKDMKIWIDKSTMYLIKIESLGKDKYVWQAYDYRKVDGKFGFPYKSIATTKEGVITQIIEEFSIKKQINDSYFDVENIKVEQTDMGDIQKMLQGLMSEQEK